MAGDVVFVSGGAGFIGWHVIEGLLASGDCRVRVLDDFVTSLRENLAYSLDQIDQLLPRLQLHWAGTRRAARSTTRRVRAHEHVVFAFARETGGTGCAGRHKTSSS